MQLRPEEFRAQAAECEELAKRYGGLIKQQYERLAGQWLFLAEQNRWWGRTRTNQTKAAAEESHRDVKCPLIVRDAVLLCTLQNWR
jgi:hypothetical protein